MKRKLFGMTGVLAALPLVFGLIFAGCNAPTDSGTNSLFTVTFNANGGTPAPAAQSVTSGDKASEPSGVARAGYTLEGWYKEAAFTNKWNFASDTVTANITLYAKWTQNAAGTFTVTFNANGGTPVPAAQNVTSGGNATEPNGVTKTGYTLEGWYKEAAFTTMWTFASDTVTADITLYAKWTQNAAETFTVTFNVDGGTSAPAAQSVTAGGKATEPSGVAKAGYTLEGWYKEAALTTKWNFASDTVTANITLYANWIVNAGALMTRTVSGKEIKFRYVPSGSFQRDGTAANVSVITQGYWLGETEVTQELFEAVMGTNPRYLTSDAAAEETQGKRPVEQVSWYDAIAFCNKLSVADEKQPVYTVSGISDWSTLDYDSIPTSTDSTWDAVTQDLSKNGYRLPTEMEWMWAAMGADKTTQPNTSGYNKAFAGSNGSNSIGDYAWYNSNSSNKTHEAGKKTVNELNLSDMSGNVYEWVWDWYGSYSSGELTDLTGPASGTNRVLRGGCWFFDANVCAVAYRYSDSAPDNRNGGIGFRVLAAP
jgi:uncharacterized repeat protein (TIGR02543 family)